MREMLETHTLVMTLFVGIAICAILDVLVTWVASRGDHRQPGSELKSDPAVRVRFEEDREFRSNHAALQILSRRLSKGINDTGTRKNTSGGERSPEEGYRGPEDHGGPPG